MTYYAGSIQFDGTISCAKGHRHRVTTCSECLKTDDITIRTMNSLKEMTNTLFNAHSGSAKLDRAVYKMLDYDLNRAKDGST